MNTRGLIPWNYTELAETVPIDAISESSDKPAYLLSVTRASATFTHNTLGCIWMYMKAQTKVEAASPTTNFRFTRMFKELLYIYNNSICNKYQNLMNILRNCWSPFPNSSCSRISHKSLDQNTSSGQYTIC